MREAPAPGLGCWESGYGAVRNMPKSLATISALVGAMALVMTQACAAGDRLDVHEWGTFTSVAGTDGVATGWFALGGPNDLPCFVHRLENDGSLKAGLIGTVRMETPVLYFYTQRELTITVEVRFPQGLITEWYPRAELASRSSTVTEGPRELRDGSITWRNASITPNTTTALVADSNASHYYAARAVEAAPLRVGDQQEKFLFYRGVGNFSLPISARPIEDGAVAVDSLTDDAVDWLIFFEKRGSKIGFHIYDGLRARQRLTIEMPPLDGDAVRLQAEIEGRLIAQGLYPSEAKAMVKTWHDAWFEEGARLLYVVPRRAVDAVLPLSITPSPDETVRVFMGRLEVITPATLQAVERAIADSDAPTLARYGRFIAPIVQRISADRRQTVDQTRLDRLITVAYGSATPQPLSCPAPRGQQ